MEEGQRRTTPRDRGMSTRFCASGQGCEFSISMGRGRSTLPSSSGFLIEEIVGTSSPTRDDRSENVDAGVINDDGMSGERTSPYPERSGWPVLFLRLRGKDSSLDYLIQSRVAHRTLRRRRGPAAREGRAGMVQNLFGREEIGVAGVVCAAIAMLVAASGGAAASSAVVP